MKKSTLLAFVAIFVIISIIGVNIIINVYAENTNTPDSICEITTEPERTTFHVGTDTTSQTETETIPSVEENTPPVETEATTPCATSYIMEPVEYTIRQGDSLWKICSDFYGDSSMYKAVMLYNELESETLTIGDTIILPIDEEEEKFANCIELANSGKGNTIHTGNNREYSYGKRVDPAVDITPDGSGRNYTEDVDTSSYTYLGEYRITGYTPGCVHCCGNGEGITASGTKAISGYTVATASHLPFGTTLYIEGYGFYVVEDRGNLSEYTIDIAADAHEQCYNLTGYANVYIVG